MHEIFGHKFDVFTSQVYIIEFNTNENVNILSDPSHPQFRFLATLLLRGWLFFEHLPVVYLVTLCPRRKSFLAAHRETRYATIDKQLLALTYGLDKNRNGITSFKHFN